MPPSIHTAELWILRHGDDAVRCVATTHPMGIEVRYVINENPLMARVLPDWTDAQHLAETWRKRLEASGWVAQGRRRSSVWN